MAKTLYESVLNSDEDRQALKENMMVWFFLLMAAGGSFYIIATVYEWKWMYRQDRFRLYVVILGRPSWRTYRKVSLLVGLGGVAWAITGICTTLLSSNSPLLCIISFSIGFSLSCLFANTLSNHRQGQSLIELFRNSKE